MPLQSLGGLVTSFGSVDPSLAAERSTARLPRTRRNRHARRRAIFGWAIAVTLTDLPHARATLIDGESAQYDGKEDGILTTRLTRKGGASNGAWSARSRF